MGKLYIGLFILFICYISLNIKCFYVFILDIFKINIIFLFKKIKHVIYNKCIFQMAKKKFYGIKFPFTAEQDENYYVDTNYTLKDKIRSILMHIVFTPKGQKIRDPEFGTNLIKYIFQPTDDETFGGVKSEIQDIMGRYLPNVTVNSVKVLKSEDNLQEIFVRLDYTVSDGFIETKDNIVVSL